MDACHYNFVSISRRPMHDTRSAHLILHDFITLKVLGKEYKSRALH